jgi:hypothetical protein
VQRGIKDKGEHLKQQKKSNEAMDKGPNEGMLTSTRLSGDEGILNSEIEQDEIE